jgi:hypothetical protein
LRPPVALGPLPLIQLAGDIGCAGVVVDGGCLLGQVAQVALKTMWARMAVHAIYAPLPEERLTPGRRMPSLGATDDPEERLAAVKLVRRAIESTRDLGVGVWGLDFGRVLLHADEDELRSMFARRELGEGESGHARLQRAVSERRGLGPALLDACRASLDAAIRLAERHDLRLALRFGAGLWDVPTPRETVQLLDDYRGAPLGVIYSPARLAILTALGVGPSAELRQRLRKAAMLLEAADAVGLDYPLVAGQAEVDLDDLRGADQPMVMTGPADASPEEVQAARTALDVPPAKPDRPPEKT